MGGATEIIMQSCHMTLWSSDEWLLVKAHFLFEFGSLPVGLSAFPVTRLLPDCALMVFITNSNQAAEPSRSQSIRTKAASDLEDVQFLQNELLHGAAAADDGHRLHHLPVIWKHHKLDETSERRELQNKSLNSRNESRQNKITPDQKDRK